ncbi:MAG: recombinase family protein [Armatimonadota bacterium]|nr:recombinase family protein [bacterium]
MIYEIDIKNEEDAHLHQDILATRDGLQHVAGYIRTACVCQEDESSVEMQRQVIRDFCMQRFPEGCRLFWISDIPASGTLPWKRDGLKSGEYREGLTVLVDLVKRGLVWYVCTSRIDRLARSAKLLIEFVDECIKPLGISLYSVTEMAALERSNDLLPTTLLALEQHRLASGEVRIIDGPPSRLDQGYIVGRPPYGWAWEDAGSIPHARRVGIQPRVKNAAVVRRIVEAFIAGGTVSQIAQQLTSDNVPTPGGAQRWSPKMIRRVLCCPVHYGLIHSADGTLVRGAHFDRRLFNESVYDQITKIFRRRG